MTAQNSELVAFVVFAMAGLLLLQSILTLVAIAVVRKKASGLEARIGSLFQQSAQLLEKMQCGIDQAAGLVEKLPFWLQQLSRTTKAVSTVSQELDDNATRTLAFLRKHMETAENYSDRLLESFATQTAKVFQAVANPAHAISDTLSAAFARLFKRRPTQHEHPVAERQIFI